MRNLVLFVIGFIGCLCLLSYGPVEAQDDQAQIKERYFTGTGDIAVEIPCETIRGLQRTTMFHYALVSFPNDDGANDVDLVLIPSRGEDWGGVLLTYAADASSVGVILDYELTIYPQGKLKVEWSNPGAITWRMVVVTRALNY